MKASVQLVIACSLLLGATSGCQHGMTLDPKGDLLLGTWQCGTNRSGSCRIMRTRDTYVMEQCHGYVIPADEFEAGLKKVTVAAGTRIGEFRWDDSRGLYLGRHVWVGKPGKEIEWGEWGGLQIEVVDASQMRMTYNDSLYKGGWVYDRVREPPGEAD